MQGETVQIEFSSADATTAAVITIKDANLVTRTLLSSERLLIDTLNATLAAAVTLLEIFSDDGDGNVEALERIASFGPNCGNFVAGEEGFPCHVGTTPKAKAANAGQVTVTGSGRIVNALGRTTRPTWKQTAK